MAKPLIDDSVFSFVFLCFLALAPILKNIYGMVPEE